MSHASKPTVANYREFKEYPKIVAAVARILAKQRFVAPAELFVEMNLLPAADLERWKRGQVPVLERVIRCNLTKAGRILRLLRFHAHDLNLKPSITVYQHKGHRLRFSRSGEPKIKEAYSTHLVVVGKRNPFAEPDARTIPCDKKRETEPKGPLAE
ncbi:MAG: hypothetical protein MUF13_04755 [Akkermansiaceae bacterium]|nr:hypothetical protein [Akkermansiaceae bacterium]